MPETLQIADVPLRRVLTMGVRGNDVLAVRRALSDAELIRWPAGGFNRPWHRLYDPLLVRTVGTFQVRHGLRRDGKYGEDTHKKLFPHFDSYGAMLMRSFRPQPAGRVTLAASADRPGVRTKKEVIDFLELVSVTWGKPILIGTGSNHSKYTDNGHISEHWVGAAADIPESGTDLTRLGQAALIRAGWSPARASRAFGDIYNVHKGGRRYQIIFNSPDHWDHLHVGIRGI